MVTVFNHDTALCQGELVYRDALFLHMIRWRGRLTNFIFLSLILNRRKRAARRDQSLPIRPLEDILRNSLMEPCGVTQRHDYRSVHMFCHFFDNLFCKGSRFCRRSNQYMRFYFLDHREKVFAAALPFIIFTCIGCLAWS